MLKNAKTQYFSEHEEIATYMAIETLAESVGDTDTAKLARAIRRDEERMAKYLARQIPVLTKAVVSEEVPASERRNETRSTTRRRAKPRKASSTSTRSRSASGRTTGRKRGSSQRRSTRSRARSSS